MQHSCAYTQMQGIALLLIEGALTRGQMVSALIGLDVFNETEEHVITNTSWRRDIRNFVNSNRHPPLRRILEATLGTEETYCVSGDGDHSEGYSTGLTL